LITFIFNTIYSKGSIIWNNILFFYFYDFLVFFPARCLVSTMIYLFIFVFLQDLYLITFIFSAIYREGPSHDITFFLIISNYFYDYLFIFCWCRMFSIENDLEYPFQPRNTYHFIYFFFLDWLNYRKLSWILNQIEL
jgi:hypothetical protein